MPPLHKLQSFDIVHGSLKHVANEHCVASRFANNTVALDYYEKWFIMLYTPLRKGSFFVVEPLGMGEYFIELDIVNGVGRERCSPNKTKMTL